MNTSALLWVTWLSLANSTLAAAAPAKTGRVLCVYDPSGAHGDGFRLAKDYRDAALGWGFNLTLKPYTDERTAAADFKARQCHAVLLTGLRARQFNRFSGTIEAVGSLPRYEQLGSVIQHLAVAAARPLLQSGDYETAAIFPAGAVYLFLRDRRIHTVPELAGRRIATMDFDDAARLLVGQVGASTVAADVGTFGPMFNNGGVDACYAPAVAYGPLELHKGLGERGGIVRYPLGQLTYQVVARRADFPDAFFDASRGFAAEQFPRLLKLVHSAEAQIPANRWIDIPAGDERHYEAMFQQVRLKLRDEHSVYDKTMLTLLRRVRCKGSPSAAECAQMRE